MFKTSKTIKENYVKIVAESDINTFWNMITHIFLFISLLPDIIQKKFCTSDRPMDPTFQMKYVPAF